MNIEGVIFDLDGVLVDTIPLHYSAWKRLFDEYGYTFNEQIYRQKVDGLPRLDGVLGVMEDLDEQAAIVAGNQKQDFFLELITQQGIQPFSSTIPFINAMKQLGISMAVASSSVNASAILENIGILEEFETVVTAEDVVHGKPHPDMFLMAAQRLGISVSNCVVFEDAESGIKAAKRGGFFCVGVDRHQYGQYFAQADMVVKDLGEVEYEVLERQFQFQN